LEIFWDHYKMAVKMLIICLSGSG